jgi:hypothetical protein
MKDLNDTTKKNPILNVVIPNASNMSENRIE